MFDVLIGNFLLAVVGDRTGAGMGAAFSYWRRRRSILSAVENEHIERGIRRATLKASIACINIAAERAGGHDQLGSQGKPGEYDPKAWVGGDYPSQRTIRIFKDEVEALFEKITPGTEKQSFKNWRDVVNPTLDGIETMSRTDALIILVNAAYRETLTAGKWDGEPALLRLAFDCDDKGFLFQFKNALHAEFKDTRAPEFRNIHTALALQDIQTGTSAIKSFLEDVKSLAEEHFEISKAHYELGLTHLEYTIAINQKLDEIHADGTDGIAPNALDGLAGLIDITKLSLSDQALLAGLSNPTPDELAFLQEEYLDQIGDLRTAIREVERQRDRRGILENTIKTLRQIIVHQPEDRDSLSIPELQAMYSAVAIISGPDLYQAYTERSFDFALWQDLIKQPQDLAKTHNSSNHLHFSNLLTAQKITLDLIDRFERGDLKQNDTVRLLEAGSGGCNTSYAVINAILNHPGLIHLNLNIEFLAFEINPRFAYWGNNLFRGRKWPSVDDDPRCSSLHHAKVSPWPGMDVFVKEGDAAAGIGRLLSRNVDELSSSVDYFFSSYMIHHVPNGDALLSFLLEPDHRRIHSTYADFRSEGPAGRLSERTIHYLKLLLEGNDEIVVNSERRIAHQTALVKNASHTKRKSQLLAYAIDAVAYCLASHTFLGATKMREKEYDYLQASIARSVEHAKSMNAGPFGFQWAQEYFHDPQSALFMAIEALLKPGGLMIVADPDGTSSFNSVHAAGNDQMATELMVAQFRDFARMSDVLGSNPLFFDVENEVRVVQTRDGEFDAEEGRLITRHNDLLDANLGYVLTARKKATS